jgi:hypothetical protein
MNSKKFLQTILVLGVLFISGCAQYMAIKQPKPYSPASAVVGARRVAIIGELGEPTASEPHGTNLTDTFKYVDGGSKNNGGSKTVRVVLYTVGDLFTLWIDQIIWIPTEKFGFAGTDHVVIVDYSKSSDDLWHATSVDNQMLKGRSSKKEDY